MGDEKENKHLQGWDFVSRFFWGVCFDLGLIMVFLIAKWIRYQILFWEHAVFVFHCCFLFLVCENSCMPCTSHGSQYNVHVGLYTLQKGEVALCRRDSNVLDQKVFIFNESITWNGHFSHQSRTYVQKICSNNVDPKWSPCLTFQWWLF